ncbi:MAG TPA: hypothetical protein VK934_11550 [Fimbriimonas sp.]|nr:hypothetical protein [Fimbriimonas sp.]
MSWAVCGKGLAVDPSTFSRVAQSPPWRLGALLSGHMLSDLMSNMTTLAQVKLMRRSNSFGLLQSRFA